MSVTFPTISGYQGFWNVTGDFNPYTPLPRSVQGWRSKLEWQIAALIGKQQMREQKELLLTLLGVAPGQAALATYKRVQPPTGPSNATPQVTGVGDMGGNVSIETVTVIDRVSAAADVTYLTSLFDGTMYPGPNSITFQNDLSGNGGGGKLGF